MRYRFQSRGQIYTINIERKGSTFRVELGENTHEILTKMLGLAEKDIEQLSNESVI